jgi:hypothetical protein
MIDINKINILKLNERYKSILSDIEKYFELIDNDTFSELIDYCQFSQVKGGIEKRIGGFALLGILTLLFRKIEFTDNDK